LPNARQMGMVFEAPPIIDGHYRLADDLIGRYGFLYRLRALDVLQLVVALTQRTLAAKDGFVLADQVLFEIAKREKLPTGGYFSSRPLPVSPRTLSSRPQTVDYTVD
jgi:hypothetical protein